MGEARFGIDTTRAAPFPSWACDAKRACAQAQSAMRLVLKGAARNAANIFLNFKKWIYFPTFFRF